MEEKFQRLSEGYDFIEESTSFVSEALSYQDTTDLVVSESEVEKSPYKILGKACGCFAPIGEFSRNKRLYSEDLWPTVLANEEFSSRLANRSIFGCISHSDKRVDDVDIREGKVSHIVSKLEIREDVNHKPYLYGELEILDTPAGRILEAMYKGGANLYVSSRGAGKLIPVPGKDYSLVKPDSYFVECFDVVCRPGFLKARPVYEGIKEEQETVKEEAIVPTVTEGAWATIAPVSEATYTIYNPTQEAVDELKGQVEKLAKIIEKVVDDVYEESTEENAVQKECSNEALVDLVNLLSSSKVPTKVFEEIVDLITASKKEIK